MKAQRARALPLVRIAAGPKPESAPTFPPQKRRGLNSMFGLTTGLLVLGAVTAAPSDDEVRLADGRVLVGTVQRDGDTVSIETVEGTVRVAEGEVVRVRTSAELEAELERLAAASPAGAHTDLELARMARGWGLLPQMWRRLDRCVEDADASAGVQRRLNDFLATLEPELLPLEVRQAGMPARARALVRQVRDAAGPARAAAVVGVLATIGDAERVLLDSARRAALPEQRWAAMRALAQRGEHHRGFVRMRAILDRDRELRREIARSEVSAGDPVATLQQWTPGLLHDDPAIRIRTANAMAELGAEQAVEVLAAAGPIAGTPRAAAGGIAKRAHMFQTTTRSIVRDFDVEIAQAAAVANPVIGTATSGVSFDVAVPAVVTKRVAIEKAYRRALHKLTGEDPGPRTDQWAGWSAARGR